MRRRGIFFFNCLVDIKLCKICKHLYIGQPSTRFSSRWNGHRATRKKMMERRSGKEEKIEQNDGCALFLHYLKRNREEIQKGGNSSNGLELSDAFEVIFVERVSGTSLNTAESFWLTNLKGTININKTFLPKIK